MKVMLMPLAMAAMFSKIAIPNQYSGRIALAAR
jgi:hypothetical protein